MRGAGAGQAGAAAPGSHRPHLLEIHLFVFHVLLPSPLLLSSLSSPAWLWSFSRPVFAQGLGSVLWVPSNPAGILGFPLLSKTPADMENSSGTFHCCPAWLSSCKKSSFVTRFKTCFNFLVLLVSLFSFHHILYISLSLPCFIHPSLFLPPRTGQGNCFK